MNGTEHNKQKLVKSLVAVSGTLKLEFCGLTSLEFFKGWSDHNLKGQAGIRNFDKQECMMIIQTDLQFVSTIIIRCKEVFETFNAMIRSPTNTYIIFHDGIPRLMLYEGIDHNYYLTNLNAEETQEKEKD